MVALFPLLLLPLFFQCSERDIVIGFAGQLTGRHSDLGVQGRNGAILAVEEINNRGGISGRPLRLLPRDDRNDPEEARSVYRELAQSGAVAVIGHMTSTQSLAALQVAEQYGIPMLSPTTSTPLLTGKRDMFFRVHAATDLAARLFGRYACQGLGFSRLVTLWEEANSAYARQYSINFSEGFSSAGGKVIDSITITENPARISEEQLTRLLSAAPDAVLIIASARETAAIAQDLRRADKELHLFTSGWAATSILPAYAGEAGEGIYTEETGEATRIRKGYLEFSETYRSRFGLLPSFAAVRSYDAVRVLEKALLIQKEQDLPLPEALTKIKDFPGLYGPFSLDDFGDIATPITILRVKDGRLKPVTQVSPEPAR